MAKRKKNAKKPAASPATNSCENDPKEHEIQDREDAFNDQEVQRQSAAIRTIRDAETERVLTGLRLLRLYFNKDQMRTPVLQYFKEHLPNLEHIGQVKNGNYEVQWKAMDENLYTGHADGGNMHAYLLNQMSMAYPDCNATMPSLGGCGVSTETVKTRILGADALNIRKFNLEEPSDTRMPGFQESVQTPGAYSQRLSFGMTPKSRRVPKHGEMLLSVHGSPLGVYKEDSMEAINESGED
ncbi:uncharacterized protein LOC108216062 [Daucus carota subsp. sativus]|uniref:uncharacterized protein LOC108216062 n=1 Tax=Daucus carota subsp. sativus TaxID=79200 RepID=UPI0007B29202|nr:PREDICTED: uncharacterized protein LOC108216062 [Daucus carota subsp. sativus]XP_017244214.1 PREDICTED: uncharacterized protein LOC108216062 [Daucus carota subsp. sativus]XP_017244215.1 PREDICTED: uncharacterized protein LOC108216062 [Daucus carota subsp. sativus]XP_017244216.1 PREDICTED: uncharacterized protein LOC108216062 [Daucus carota subsp. sativus]